MSKQIPLTQGKMVIVDDGDFEYLNQWKWYAMKDGTTWYARRNDRSTGHHICILMHQVIVKPSAGLEVDHHNGNGLDNQRSNLRSCTHRQNTMNRKKRANCTSRFKGVRWHRRSNKWEARICLNSKCHWLGYFDDELEAAKAYNKAAQELFGEFARLNVIGEPPASSDLLKMPDLTQRLAY